MRIQEIVPRSGLTPVKTGSFHLNDNTQRPVAEYITGILSRPKGLTAFYVEVCVDYEAFIGIDQSSFSKALLGAAEAARCAGYKLPLIGLHPLFVEDEATWATGWGLVGPLPVSMMETTTDLLPELGAVLLSTW